MQSKCRHLSIPKGQSICSSSQSINCMFFDDGPITSTSAFDGSLQNSLPLHCQHTNTLGTCFTWRWSSCPWRGSPSCSFPCSASAIPAASLSRLHICGHSQLLCKPCGLPHCAFFQGTRWSSIFFHWHFSHGWMQSFPLTQHKVLPWTGGDLFSFVPELCAVCDDSQWYRHCIYTSEWV